MRHIFLHAQLIAVILLISSAFGKEPSDEINGCVEIYLVSQGWHTGLIIPSSCINEEILPEKYSFNEFKYLMVGWGDRDYYQDDKFNLWHFVKAAAWPTHSVMQIIGLNSLTRATQISEDIIQLKITKSGYESLCQFINVNFTLDDNGEAISTQEGQYQNSRFFYANKNYTAIHNSNVWTAKALKEAGVAINPFLYQTKSDLIRKMSKEGEVMK